MSNKKRKIDTSRQLSIFDAIQQFSEPIDERPQEGSFNISDKLRRAVCKAIANSGLSRPQIAGEMGHLLDVEITKSMIDSWTAESKEGHRFPAEYIPALCRACGDIGPLQLMVEMSGMYAMPGPEALRAEIQKLDEQERELRAEKRKRLQFLKDMTSI